MVQLWLAQGLRGLNLDMGRAGQKGLLCLGHVP